MVPNMFCMSQKITEKKKVEDFYTPPDALRARKFMISGDAWAKLEHQNQDVCQWKPILDRSK